MSSLHLKHRVSNAIPVTLHVSVLGTYLSMSVSTSDPHGTTHGLSAGMFRKTRKK